MNKTTFFAYARRAPFGGRLSQAQVDGTSAILAEAERRGLPDGQTAYVLATAPASHVVVLLCSKNACDQSGGARYEKMLVVDLYTSIAGKLCSVRPGCRICFPVRTRNCR
ncbi:hypothetical protein [Brucella anthropi]|uniref:hypothetical protein n=1 Tax=Brucella anthropi TaxID=529 RepID=UPI000AF9E435|nr:hypothetical protein [Brucella anthropi]MDG9793138.1 hypothetical protein [Brucella anthropi]MDH0583000.1 hypothetical protein [Brucella anthropi]MDH0819616.1 hypothetical protein [Brucella anthropi]MDH2086258.1 hypothetical protein [Brucella anthropi]